MAAKGALLELLENRSLAKDEKRKQVLAVLSLSLHHAQAPDLYEEKRSHKSLVEKREKTRVQLECAAGWRGGGHYG